MRQFKNGDWVICHGEHIRQVKRVNDKTIRLSDNLTIPKNSEFYKHIQLWQPKEGEFCWFKEAIEDQYVNTGAYVFAQFEGFVNRTIDLGYNKEYTVVTAFTASIGLTYYNSAGLDCTYDFLYCEPFIGELPSFLKDTNV